MTEPVQTTRLAATILMLREGADGMEVFMVVRHQQIDFASGALVFPGGKLAAGDTDPRVRARCIGAGDLSDDALALRVCGIREAFEECGLLLARSGDGGTSAIDIARVAQLGDRYRRPLDKGELGIADMLEAEDLVLCIDELVPFAHWITPTFMPKRFDTYFYLAAAPPEQVALHDGFEAVDSAWLRPADVLEQADAGTRTLVPATRLNVEKLGQNPHVADALEAARTIPMVTVQPVLVERPEGQWLEIPEAAGYGVSGFPLPQA
jgi:8-oxo-dGTP pyrophosphatase MutT (NUDIX family)